MVKDQMLEGKPSRWFESIQLRQIVIVAYCGKAGSPRKWFESTQLHSVISPDKPVAQSL